MQLMTDWQESISKKVGLKISVNMIKNTKDWISWRWCYIPGRAPLKAVKDFIESNAVDIKKRREKKNHLNLFSFRQLQTVWASKVVDLKVTLQLYTCNVPSVAWYAFETWKVITKITNLLDMCDLSFLHKIVRMSRGDKLRNAESRGLSDSWETGALS